jgi:hypothetical protein
MPFLSAGKVSPFCAMPELVDSASSVRVIFRTGWLRLLTNELIGTAMMPAAVIASLYF